MTCTYCEAAHVAVDEAGQPVCNAHLLNPPPTQLDRIERELAELRDKLEERQR